MHIAFVVHDLGGYGTEQVAHQLVNGLSYRGHEVDVILFQTIIHRHLPQGIRVFLTRDAPDRLTAERSAQVLARAVVLRSPARSLGWARMASALHWNPYALPSWDLLRKARAVASYLEVEKPDCILPQYSPMWATFLGRHMAGKHLPIIPVVHTDVRHRGHRFRLRARYLLPEATHLVSVSQGVSDSLADVIGVPTENITTIYNPVVTPDLANRATEQPNHPWFLDHGAPIILAAGRLEKHKDYPTLIRAFARLAGLRPCRLVILGRGSKQHELEALAKDLAVADRVSFAGWTDNPFTFMARASLFVLSSRWEGFGLVLAEALACGCPCVSTDCPSGPAEILLNGDLGPLVSVGDDAALAEAMGRVLDDPPDRRLLQQRAAYFSADRAVAAYEELITSVVQRSGGPSCVSS